MRKLFNVAGPCIPGEHYILDPFRGIGDELMNLIDTKQYFVIHAARQSGKTTLLNALAEQINKSGKYYALYCSLEAMDSLPNPKEGIPEIVQKILLSIKRQSLPAGFAQDANYDNFTSVLNASFVEYCRDLDKPLVVFFDEADCLVDNTLINFLRQLREGYISRQYTPFIHSVALVGMRNLRDYKVQVRPGHETLGGASPFNIATEYINLRTFNREEVFELYAQHTAETGQVFETDAIELAFERTYGQPWLVNAIAREAVEKICKYGYNIPITAAMINQAIQNIILARSTHFDSLMRLLNDQRVRSVIKPLIMGEQAANRFSDDYLYTRDLGFIKENANKIEVANPIYAEVIVRTLNFEVQDSIANTHENYDVPRYLKDGKIDMSFLLTDFQEFWRENSEIWVERYKRDLYQYDEAATHLVLQAFLQRVLNGGGDIIREMALGTRRADLCVVYDGFKYPIELKIKQSIRKKEQSWDQILRYMDKLGEKEGWLVIFDKDPEVSWDDKIYMHEEIFEDRKVVIVGC